MPDRLRTRVHWTLFGVFLVFVVTFPPLLVAVSLVKGDALAGWQRDALVALGATFALALALITAAHLIAREVRARAAATARLVDADAALRTSRERFQAVLDHAPLMVAVKDLHGRYTFINRTATDRLGVAPADMLGKSAYDVFPDAHAELQAAFDREVLVRKAPVQREIVMPSASGPRTMLMIKFPLIGARGAIEAIGSIAADISELKQAPTCSPTASPTTSCARWRKRRGWRPSAAPTSSGGCLLSAGVRRSSRGRPT